MEQRTTGEAIYTFTIPLFIRGLETIGRILTKAEAHAKAAGIEMQTLLDAQLRPDMFNLLQQVQYACFLPVDFARHFSKQEVYRTFIAVSGVLSSCETFEAKSDFKRSNSFNRSLAISSWRLFS